MKNLVKNAANGLVASDFIAFRPLSLIMIGVFVVNHF
tara:strand:- start:87 stop:197 length:111 start_codon:yes stop_codon:yes gene_type:complete